MVTLNVRGANSHATTAGLASNTNPEDHQIRLIHSSKIGLCIAGVDITNHHATHLRKAATSPAMLVHCLKRCRWTTTDQFDMIDWKACHDAIQEPGFSKKKFVAKFVNRRPPVGSVLHNKIPHLQLMQATARIENPPPPLLHQPSSHGGCASFSVSLSATSF
jgi:hypothetical protein